MAARSGDLETVLALIDAGEDLDVLDAAVGSPLHWAVARGHVEVAEALLAAGAPVDLPAHAPDHLTPLHLAASSGHVAVIRLLVGAGADLSVGAGGVGTPLHFAAGADKGDATAALLEAGADPEAVAGRVFTIYPLQFAARSGGTDALDVLIAAGVPIDAANEHGTTALHLAVHDGQVAAAEHLIGAGADPLAESSTLETPAKQAAHIPEMRALFVKLGVVPDNADPVRE